MGYIKHQAIIVTGSEKEDAELAREVAVKLGLDVTPIGPGGVNGYTSFLICPDGSKEGWGHSTEHEALRERWIEWARGPHSADEITRYAGKENEYKRRVSLDWALVRFGGDDDEFAEIQDHGGRERTAP